MPCQNLDPSNPFRYSKTCLKRPLSYRPKMGFQDQLSLNAGQKYCRMLQGEQSTILLTCIELPHGFKTFVLSIFEWPLKTGFTVVVHVCLKNEFMHLCVKYKNHMNWLILAQRTATYNSISKLKALVATI